MKKTILISILAVFTLYAKAEEAANVIVAASNGITTSYTTLFEAINTATDGSTISIPSGVHTISQDMTINKELHFKGNGYNTLAVANNDITLVQGNSFTFKRGANGSTFEGIRFDNDLGMLHLLTDNSGTFDLMFSRCRLSENFTSARATSAVGYENLNNINTFFNECVLYGINLDYDVPESVFASHIIVLDESGSGYVKGVEYGKIEFSIILDNALTISYSRNISIVNCVSRSISTSGSENVTVQNSLINQGYSIDNDITQINNQTQEWEFIFENAPDTEYDYAYDYHLKDGSLAIGNGTLGTDIGIYGGSTPWKDGGVPAVPYVYDKSVSVRNNSEGAIEAIYKVKAQEW